MLKNTCQCLDYMYLEEEKAATKERLLLWRTGDVHGIVLGEDGTFTCDDALCVKKGAIGDVGVLVYGESRQ